MGIGAPPAPWAAGMAEMMVTDYAASLVFWTGVLGFGTAFERPAQKLSCLVHPDGAQVMIYERDGDWETGAMERPFGRGLVVQVYVADAGAAAARDGGGHDLWPEPPVALVKGETQQKKKDD